MNLFSLVRSSAWEVMLSKRVVVAFYFLIGAAAIVGAAASSFQFFDAYVNLHQFDVTSGDFLWITLLLFLPYWFVTGLLLRACLQRMRLALWARRAFRIAAYQVPLAAAEAGYIVDSEFNHRELVATLVSLHYRQALTLSFSGERVNIQVAGGSMQAFSYAEQQLLSLLSGSQRSYVSFRDPALIAYSKQVQDVLIAQLESKGYIRRERLPSPVLKIVFRVLYWIAGIVGVITVISLFADFHGVTSIDYPRYPVTTSEPVVLALVLLAVAATIASGFWPRYKQRGAAYLAWTEAAGYLLYLRTVYKDRLSVRYLASQDAQTLRTIAPYAIAFGVMPDDVRTIASLLQHS